MDQVITHRGQFVLISSAFAFLNGMGTVPYAMSKAAVEQRGRGLRVVLAALGVSTNYSPPYRGPSSNAYNQLVLQQHSPTASPAARPASWRRPDGGRLCAKRNRCPSPGSTPDPQPSHPSRTSGTRRTSTHHTMTNTYRPMKGTT